MSYLHHNKGVPFLHGDFKPSDVLVPAKTLQPKITNFALWDFKNFFIDNAQPELDHIQLLNPCQAPEVLGKHTFINFNNLIIKNHPDDNRHFLTFTLCSWRRKTNFVFGYLVPCSSDTSMVVRGSNLGLSRIVLKIQVQRKQTCMCKS